MKRRLLLILAVLAMVGSALAVTIPGLVSGATGLTSRYRYYDSGDGDFSAWADCANEPVEVADSGVYNLNMTAGELNHDLVVVQVVSNEGDTVTMILNTSQLPAYVPEPPTTPLRCRVYGWLKKPDGTALASKTISATIRRQDWPVGYDSDGDGVIDSGLLLASTAVTTTTQSDGYWAMDLTYSARVRKYGTNAATRYSFRANDAGLLHDATVPSTSTALFDSLSTYTATSKP